MSKPVLGLLAGLALVSAAPLALRKGSRNASDVAALQRLLAYLRALRQVYHTTHWNVQGSNYYGDHLLFQRLYAGEEGASLDDQIDGLGERMVRYFGSGTVDDNVILPMMQQIVSSHTEPEPIRRAYHMEQAAHKAIEDAYEALKATGHKTLGLDDFLMALADERDTVLYLLGQRLDEPATFRQTKAQPQRRQQQRQQQGAKNKGSCNVCGSPNCGCMARGSRCTCV